jgi:hypothetical protein
VAVDNGAFDATEEILLKYLLGFFWVADIGDVLVVHGVRIAAFDPASRDAGFGEGVANGFVGADDDALGIWDVAAQKDSGHALADTVLDAIAGIYYKRSIIFKLLEQSDRARFAAHVDDDVFANA